MPGDSRAVQTIPPTAGTPDILNSLDLFIASLDRQPSIEAAAALCLSAVCEAGSWVRGRFELTPRDPCGRDPVLVNYPVAQPADREARPDDTASYVVTLDVGVDWVARFELRGGRIEAPSGQGVARVIGQLLGRFIERLLLTEARARVEADRAQKWKLLKLSEDALREQHARLHTAINNITQGLAMYDGDSKMVLCNGLYASMYGMASNDVRPGTSNAAIAERRRASGFEIVDTVEQGAFETHGALALKSENRTWRLRDGRRIVVVVQPLWNGGWVTTHQDVTERKRFEEKISHLAMHDSLTDLANRLQFRERLDRALTDLGRGGPGLAVLWLDLDRFKIVNDSLGHLMGDLLLRAVAERLRRCARGDDLVARLGGDEFAILQTPVTSAEDIDALALRVRNAIAAPFRIDGQRILIDVSIGVCAATDATRSADELLLNADTALYRAKAEGRGTYRFFTPSMDTAILYRRQLESKLRMALDNDEFEPHYQLIVDLETGAVVACEALLRWNNAELGSVSPADFIPVAEEAGLMERLGRWLLARACTDASRWPAHVSLAVNISPSHVITRQLIADVERALETTRFPAERLEVEITETVLMRHTDEALRTLHELCGRGVKLAMDDFGTGYSSLAYLGRFPFSKIKIDQSFVAGLPADRNSHAIVRAITGLSEGMGLITTAEGVETESQLEAVAALGCRQVQGRLFSRPLANDALLSLFARLPPTLELQRAVSQADRMPSALLRLVG